MEKKESFRTARPAVTKRDQESLVQRLRQGWQWFSRPVCSWLNRKTAHCSSRQATIALAVFCGAFVSISLSVTVGALYQQSGTPRAVIQLEKRLPTLPGRVERRPGRVVSVAMDRRRTFMQRWLDSLAHRDTVAYQQMLGQHPTLLPQLQWLDSICQNENDSLWNLKRSR